MGNKVPKLPREDLDMLVTKTSFTEPQIKSWYRGFMRDCPSGELSRKKFLSIYKALFPDGQASAFYDHVFRTFDEDGSGRIDFKEFIQAISITQDGRPEEKLELAFRLYDIDRSGTIEVHEMAEIIEAIYLMTGGEEDSVRDTSITRTKDIFDKMDLNSDGVLSKDEFVMGCLKDETLYRLLACSNEDPAKES